MTESAVQPQGRVEELVAPPHLLALRRVRLCLDLEVEGCVVDLGYREKEEVL
ncbi:hypothetical protein A2U01_0102439 [Trifolium medium]|uniref:Uncharacterized protein n=1 Tax=Trifolium medium TaxID=97028 RepID=A0A392UZ71_9FABA|nr:hypothetical protein [Trifolium medium]